MKNFTSPSPHQPELFTPHAQYVPTYWPRPRTPSRMRTTSPAASGLTRRNCAQNRAGVVGHVTERVRDLVVDEALALTLVGERDPRPALERHLPVAVERAARDSRTPASDDTCANSPQPHAKKSPTGHSTAGCGSSSQYMRRIWLRQLPVGVSQMCWIAPEPSMSASTNVSCGAIDDRRRDLPSRPSSRPGPAPVPSVAIPPRPFSPVKFSGLIERVSASARRHTFAEPDAQSVPFLVVVHGDGLPRTVRGVPRRSGPDRHWRRTGRLGNDGGVSTVPRSERACRG